ncbi:MAG: serine/threonine protein kinase [Planctomycetia bacterium]|nr:serine/threonine protein kinase [Planctomycetia bacterium]
MTEQVQNAEAVFLAAMDKANEAERNAYVEEACAGNVELLRQVRELLASHDATHGPLDAPPPGLGGSVLKAHSGEAPGTLIGPYKLLQQIGEGGMGVVFMAEQTQPVQRKVALKIIKQGMDSRQVIARFEAERQALAMMDHVNIARVIDGGKTQSGRPYFVMDLIHGVPITRYCDDNHLTPQQRLELFTPVCQAIQHAHQKGIIHRDIKPSNVLITLYDGKPVPKVIDFGVAKATEQKLTERTLFTNYGTMVGTLEYMSPEQAEMSGLGVDTRSDIYSLGVLLYELLTGSTPLDRKRVRDEAYAEILRIIKEEEPPRPSTRLSDSGDALASISAQRQMEPAKLTKLVRGELDWIVMKSLEKDRNRRYESASGLAQDIQRYLADEPVHASPPSVTYRLRKFVRRNKVALLTISVVALALIAGTVISIWQAYRATQAEEAAKTDRDTALAEKTRADEEATIAQTVNDFLLNDLLAEAAPSKNARNKKVSVEELLGRAATRIDGKFEKQPRIEAAIRMTIGYTYHALSNYAAALPQLERAMEIRRRVLGDEHPDTLAAMGSVVLVDIAQGQYQKAELLNNKVQELRQRVFGEEHPETLTSMHNLVLINYYLGQYSKAMPLCIKTLETRQRVLGEQHTHTLETMQILAALYKKMGQHEKAVPLFGTVLDVRRRTRGEEHPETLYAMNNLALIYHQPLGRYAEAESLYIKVLDARSRILGPEHSDTLTSMNNLAVLYKDQELYDKAEPLYLAAVDGFRKFLGDDHPQTVLARNNLAVVYKGQGKYGQAESMYETILEIQRRTLRLDHPDTLIFMNNLAVAYYEQGKFAKAEQLHQQTLERKQRVLGKEHPSTLVTMNILATIDRDQGQYAKAETEFLKVLEIRKRVLGEEHPQTLITLNDLSALYLAQNDFVKSEQYARMALDKARKRHPGTSQLADAITSIVECLLKQQKYAEAEPLLRECLNIREQKHPDNWRTFHTRSMLGGSLLEQKKYAEAEPLLIAAYAGLHERESRIPVPNQAKMLAALERMVQLYDATGNKEKTEVYRNKLEIKKKETGNRIPELEKKPVPNKK